MKILVTGKTGVGKSFLLSKYKYYSFDQQNKNVWIKKGEPYFNFIKSHFGDEYVNSEKINLTKLGKKVIESKDALAKINSFAKPYIRKWIENLPDWSIVEFAQYINSEKDYYDLFDKIILVENKKPILKNKFNYLNKKVQPIEHIKINYDFLIDNTGFSGEKNFDKSIKKIFSKKDL